MPHADSTYKTSRAPYFLIGFVSYFCLISVGSHIPGESIARLGFDIWDKALHAAEYLPLGLLAAMAMRRRPLRFSRLIVMAAGLVLIFVLGAIDELHQSFVPGRFCTVSDAVADGLGGFAGIFLAMFVDGARMKKL
jgi:VanZ family protein